MSNQEDKNHDEMGNQSKTDILSNKETQNQTNNLNNTEIPETTAKQGIPQNSNDIKNINDEAKNIENNQNQENSENKSTDQTNEQNQQTQSAKSTSGRNRHNTTDEEKRILSKNLQEYLKLPNRTTDRQNKERNVAKELKALNPECNKYWNYKKVRDWFNNNNPDKRTKNQETENQHNTKKINNIPGSAPIRFFTSENSYRPEIRIIPELSSQIFGQYISNQNRSQFINCYNVKSNTPTSSAMLSLNSQTKFLPAAQGVQMTSVSEACLSCYNNTDLTLSNGSKITSDVELKPNTHFSPQGSASNITPFYITSKFHNDKKENDEPPNSTNTLPQPQIQQQKQPLKTPQSQIQSLQSQPQQLPIAPQVQIQHEPIQPPQIQQPPLQVQQQQVQSQPQLLPVTSHIQIQHEPIQILPTQIQQQQQQQAQQQPIQVHPPQMQQHPAQSSPKIIQIPQPQIQQTQQNPPPQIQQQQQNQQLSPQPIQILPNQIQQQSQIQPPQIQRQQIPPPQIQQTQKIQPLPPQIQPPPKSIQISQNLQSQPLIQPQPQLLTPQLRYQHQPQFQTHPPVYYQPSSVQNAQNDEISMLNSSSTGDRIRAEIPENLILNRNTPKKKTSFRKAFEKEEERVETIRRRIEEEKSPSSAINFGSLQSNANQSQQGQISRVNHDFHLTPVEKYQQKQQQQQQQQQFKTKNSYNYSSSSSESISAPGSFIEYRKNGESLAFLNSSIKMKSKNKTNSDEHDPLPLVPEDEIKSFTEKLRSITLNRITSLIKIIEEKKHQICKQIDENNKKKLKKNQLQEDNENNDNSQSSSSSSENENENEKERKNSNENESLNVPFIYNHEAQIEFEKKIEDRMNELIDFYHKQFGNNPIILTFSSGITKKDNPPIPLTQQTLLESGEFSPNNKHLSEDKIEDIINERKCIVNFGRKSNFQTKIHVPKDITRENEKLIKFYRGDFDKKETIPLTVYDGSTQVESSVFLSDSDEIFFTSYDFQQKSSLFVFRDSMIETPFKKFNRFKTMCKYPDSNNLILATDGDKLVCFNIEKMTPEFIYHIPDLYGDKQNRRKRSESSQSINVFNINVRGFQQYQNQRPISDDDKDKAAICAFKSGDIVVGKNNVIYFYNREKNEKNHYKSIILENMKKVSSIAPIEIKHNSDADSVSFSYIVVGDLHYPTIYVFNTKDDSLVARLVGHTSGISCLYASRYTLFSGSVDGSIRIWEFKLTKYEEKDVQKEIKEKNKNDNENDDDDDDDENDVVDDNHKNQNYALFALCSLTLLMHSAPIVAMRVGKVGSTQFLISCDSNLIRATDITRKNPSFSISVPEEFSINSLNFDGNLGEVDFILASRRLDKFADRLGIFSFEK